MSNARIRKQVYQLTPEDLLLHAVWEFALDEEGEEGQDEATVCPYLLDGPLDPSDGLFVVRARLELADGTRLCGYLTPPVQPDSSLGTIQPAIVVDGGQVSFWCGLFAPDSSEIAASYALLGKSLASEVFPVKFESDVELIGGPVTGELPGFLILEDVKARTTRVVK